jgi:hypothetical protein
LIGGVSAILEVDSDVIKSRSQTAVVALRRFTMWGFPSGFIERLSKLVAANLESQAKNLRGKLNFLLRGWGCHVATMTPR